MLIFGSKGLIKANLKTYFKARSKGLNKNEALDWVIQSRYPMSKQNQMLVRSEFKYELNKSKDPLSKYAPGYEDLSTAEAKIKKLVKIIYFFENPQPLKIDFRLALEQHKIEHQIDQIYESLKKKYRL